MPETLKSVASHQKTGFTLMAAPKPTSKPNPQAERDMHRFAEQLENIELMNKQGLEDSERAKRETAQAQHRVTAGNQ